MAQTSRPWQSTSPGDAGPYSSSQWQDIYKYLLHALRPNSGAIIDSGTAPNTGLQVQATNPVSAAVDVLAGAALVEGVYYANDATVTLSIAANASGNPRIDTVVLRKDYTAQTVRLAVLTGTPAGSPTPPSLTQSDGTLWEIPLADIAVASGFASIANSNITPRHEWANAADGVYLSDVLNNSGITLETGRVVIWDSTTDRAVTTTTVPDDKRVAGVWVGRTANGAYGRVQKSGIGYVKVSAAITRGNRLGTGTSAGQAIDCGGRGQLGLALQSTAGADLVPCLIDIQSQQAYVKVEDQKAQNTDGGTFSAGAWRTRDINTVVNKLGYFSTLADASIVNANQITLPPGTYRCAIRCPAYLVNKNQARLYNITGAAVLVLGSSNRTPSGGSPTTYSYINGSFTLTATSVVEVQHICETTGTTTGYGQSANFTTEVFTTAEFWRD